MDLGTQPAAQLLAGAVTVLGGVVVVLWKALQDARVAHEKALQEIREDLEQCQTKYTEELKERYRDSELFLRALGKKRSGSSDTPT